MSVPWRAERVLRGGIRLIAADNGFRPNPDESSQPLATSLKPLTAATLTVRIIKSFEFRTAKALVLKDVNLVELTVGALMEKCREGE